MNTEARSAASWAFYVAGSGVSRLLGRRAFRGLYPVYDRLMNWSWNLQGSRKKGPWAGVADTFVED